MKYIAYGSNLNVEQMNLRCPGAQILDTGLIENWELIYRRSKTGSFATIRPHKGKVVPIAVWNINKTHELALDHYKGYPIFYHKTKLIVALNDYGKVKGMVYIMRTDASPGRPSEKYIDTIYRGYAELELDFRYLTDSLLLNKEEILKGWT